MGNDITTLYDELLALCKETGSKFYFVDHATLNGEAMRVFSYHIANYSDWLLPSAIEARGIMFHIDAEARPISLVSRPMEKFFNVEENPLTMDLDFSKVVGVMDKADGSLISTYATGKSFALKSKTSISSTQAIDSMRYIKQDENRALYEFCEDCVGAKLTVNMEWCAPNNRIVLEYTEPKLIILNIRDNVTGDYVEFDDLPQSVLNGIAPWLVDEYDPAIASDENFISNIREMTGVEGVILRFGGEKVRHAKLKTQWYVDLHQTKDAISVPKRLVKTILNNNHDDLYALFSDDEATIQRIRDFETHIVSWLQSDVKKIVDVVKENKGLDRKFFAINGQKKLDPWLFGVYMQQYQGTRDIHAMLIDVYLRKPEMLVPEKYMVEARND